MLEIGMLIFGGLTGNLVLSIGWIILKMSNFIPVGSENISAVAIIIVAMIRKLIRLGGVR